jgi:small GTP-binding protein
MGANRYIDKANLHRHYWLIAGSNGIFYHCAVPEISRKICMLGDFGVGKTSLVARFVHSVFSDRYVTTVGVKIDTKVLELASPVLGADRLKLVIWDIAGKNALDSVKLSYLQGASGVLLVADGTREATLRSALYLLMQARQETHVDLPAVLLVNKLDRLDEWEVTASMLAELRKNLVVFETSASSGESVEQGFNCLSDQIIQTIRPTLP